MSTRYSARAAEHAVTAIRLGNLRVDSTAMVLGHNPGISLDIPVWGALIEGSGKRIIVDTGIADPSWVSDRLGPCWQSADETIEGALDVVGWNPKDVDIVINTHLHYDHCGNNHWFPNASIFVARAEWEAAHQPVSSQREVYCERDWLRGGLTLFDYSLVDVDYYDLLPGIKIIQTPGHSAGHQSVLVNTEGGTLCIAGDAANVEENFMGKPGGVIVSVPDALASIEKIRASADSILMSHDQRIQPFQSKEFPRIPRVATADCC
jgi:N-acyl homoserine lactone hydrolase